MTVSSETLFPATQAFRTLLIETWFNTSVSQSSAGIEPNVVSEAEASFVTVPAYLYFQLIVCPFITDLVSVNWLPAVISTVETSVDHSPEFIAEWTVTSSGVEPVLFKVNVDVAVWLEHVPIWWITEIKVPQSTSIAPPDNSLKLMFAKAAVL